MKLVVKLGGSILKDGNSDTIMEDLARQSGSNQLIVVHGGGDLVTDIAQRLGKEQKFIVSPEGIRSRFTDKETSEIYTMVMSGMISKRLAAALERRGVKAVSLAGVDGSLLLARRKKKLVTVDGRGRKILIDGGYTGKVEHVNSDLIERLLAGGYLPLISPVAISEEGEPLNIDGDRAAASVAVAVGARAIVFLTNVDGLMMDGKLVEKISAVQAGSFISSIGFGMQKKVMASIECIEGGVSEAIICSGLKANPVSMGLGHSNCTVIS